MAAYFDHVNANGGIGPEGLQIELVVRDDEFNAAMTIERVDELLQSEQPLYITTLGTPNTFAVQETLNNACIPQPLSMTAHQAWGDPVNNPWTTGLQLSFATEALLWGTWIEQNMPPGTRVAALVMDNDFGLAYEQVFEEFAVDSDVIDTVEFVRHDPAATTLTNEVTTLAAGEPDVFIAMTAGNPCLLALQEADRAGIASSATAAFMPSVCKTVSAYMAPAGQAADGWMILGGGWKDSADPALSDDVFIAWVNDRLSAAGLDPSNTLHATGFGQFGWVHVQALQIAAELPGGVTRTNFLLALRTMEMRHPMLFDGIAFSMNGADDAFLVEGSDVSRFDVAGQYWVAEEVIDVNGRTVNCSWRAGSGC